LNERDVFISYLILGGKERYQQKRKVVNGWEEIRKMHKRNLERTSLQIRAYIVE
jgi:hypothetical protein